MWNVTKITLRMIQKVQIIFFFWDNKDFSIRYRENFSPKWNFTCHFPGQIHFTTLLGPLQAANSAKYFKLISGTCQNDPGQSRYASCHGKGGGGGRFRSLQTWKHKLILKLRVSALRKKDGYTEKARVLIGILYILCPESIMYVYVCMKLFS